MKYCITFGQAHIHKINGRMLDKDCVAVITAMSGESGLKLAERYFGKQYSRVYLEDEFGDNHMQYYPGGKVEV